MGASVLHESAIFPVRKEGIPINIRNTNAPQDPGTMIVETTCNRPDCVITGIAGKKGFVSISNRQRHDEFRDRIWKKSSSGI